jgi:polysaccharide biosynthesis protein PslJ
MVGAMVICLVLTYSRGALAGLAVGVGIIALLRYRKLFWLLLAGVAVILLLPQTQDYVAHFVEGIMIEDLATQMRIGEYLDAIKVISAHPWLGVGFSGTPEIFLYVGVSNVYLLIAEEAGVFALALFLLVIAMFIWQLWRASRQSRQMERLDAILWGVGAAILGALATGMLDHYFFNIDFSHAVTLFWLYLGIGMIAVRMVRTRSESGLFSARHSR